MRRSSICVAFAVFTVLQACATTPGELTEADAASASRIKNGMARLGATEARGDCFAKKIAHSLDDAHQDEAIGIVEQSQTRDDMKESVLSASGAVKQAFIAANLGCSLMS